MAIREGTLSDLEKRVVERINDSYLISRKSSEIFDAEGKVPLAITPEVMSIAETFLAQRGIDVTKKDELTGWNIYWAREMVAAMTAIPNKGGMYQTYLPGRFLHYDLLAHNIASLFNGGEEDGIEGKKIAEIGCGSGLSLMKLAQRGAIVTGLDYSIMALSFAKYLSEHYGVSDKTHLINKEYFNTGFEDEAFDAVYNSGVLEHEREPKQKQLLEEMVRITKSGGYVIIAIPNEDSPFYKRFKQEEAKTKGKYPSLVRIPVEHGRYSPNVIRLMQESGLHLVREDGLQIAPSSDIKVSDIANEDLRFFEEHLVRRDHTTSPSIEDRVNTWRVLELYADRDFRLRYGWSRYFVGQKPKPATVEPKFTT